MRYTTFGRLTGLRVSEYALGTAGFASELQSGSDRQESVKMFERFAEAGGTFLDTADSYQNSESEILLGELLHSERDRFVLASKFTLGAVGNKGMSGTGNSRKVITRAVEASLARLGTDYIDLYWAHFPDGVTPIEEIMAAFDDLVRAGKILHGGFSNFPAWRVARASTIAELRGLAPIVGIQVEYSLAERSPERELLPMAEALGIGAAIYSPLGGGLLTGKYRQSDEGRLTTLKAVIQTEDSDQKTAIVDAVIRIGKEVEATPMEVSMAWLRERGRRSNSTIVSIIGPRSMAHLEGYLNALNVELSPEQYEELDHVSLPSFGVPHDAISERQGALFGGLEEAFDRPPVVA